METIKLLFHILNGIMCFIGYATTFVTILFIIGIAMTDVSTDSDEV